ncbi:MAG: hypothetical protein GWO39_08050 [Gammaproteobacteria bacterium]|nr:hypothetical protein [Gammaproteobacteria bacterium]NIT63729.1 hypothetical protein [Gammaproteobacteria bacterium]NIV20685.1 hypothetical protein [Gammaproteobacteria bacterium]NIY32309.1 hypothetical protein [Gammaproteobacteria bacterium]
MHWVRAAGGLAVVAHPARYKLTRSRLRALLEDFKDCGGAGLEVVSGTHSANDIAAMGEHARRLDLYASAGSDYHGPEQTWLELGALPPLPQGCLPIWERL